MQAVKQLSPSEKLKLNEMIWNDDLSIPEEHQKIVIERMSKSSLNPNILLDWDVASKLLKS